MRSRLLLLVLGCTIFAGAGRPSSAQTSLRFDGLYCCKAEGNSTSREPTTLYLRFYADGVGLAVASTGTAKDIVAWFHRGFAPRFHYYVKGRLLRFTEQTENGPVWYRGTVRRNYLDLDIHGRLRWNGRRVNLGKHRYDFVPLEIAP
jgi:hypothetical protein